MNDRIGSGHDDQLSKFIAVKLPLEFRYPEAAIRDRVLTTQKSRLGYFSQRQQCSVKEPLAGMHWLGSERRLTEAFQRNAPNVDFFFRFVATTIKQSSRNSDSAMRMTVEQIADEALALPSEARALLVDRLVESLDPAEDGYIRQLWLQEANRRVAEVRSGAVKTVSAEAAFKEVRQAIAR